MKKEQNAQNRLDSAGKWRSVALREKPALQLPGNEASVPLVLVDNSPLCFFPPLPSGRTADETASTAAASTRSYSSESELCNFYSLLHACIQIRQVWMYLGEECNLFPLDGECKRRLKVAKTVAGCLTSLHSGSQFPFTRTCESSTYGVFCRFDRLAAFLMTSRMQSAHFKLLTNALRFLNSTTPPPTRNAPLQWQS